MEWLTGKTVSQAILLPTLLLLIAVAATLLACGPIAQPAQQESSPQLTAQTVSEQPEPTKETQKTQATANPTSKITETPKSEPIATTQVAPTRTQEPTTAIPTPEDECPRTIVRGEEEFCIKSHPEPWPTSQYAILDERINRFLVAAEESAKSSTDPSRTEAELHKVFIMIGTRTDASTKTLVNWLENNGVRHTNRTEADVGTIHSYRGHPQYYIYANVPAYLLGSLVHQEGVAKIEDGCYTAHFCWPQ